MLRSIRLFVGAAAVLFGGVVLAQTKDAPNADGYFPVKVKSKWTYKLGDQAIEVVVSGTEKFGAFGSASITNEAHVEPGYAGPPLGCSFGKQT